MSEQSSPDDNLPPCPVCGADDIVRDVCDQIDGDTSEVAECNVCHSMIPIDVLFRWDEQRRRPLDERLKRAAELLEACAAPYDEACAILKELLAR